MRTLSQAFEKDTRPSTCTCHETVGVQPGPGPHLLEIPSEPATPFAPGQCFERQKLSLGKCVLGICQDHDVKSTSIVLPCTQRHAEFEVALRCCSGDANDDYSKIHTATRSNCSFLCIFVRQVARLVKQGNSSQRSCRPNDSSHPGSRVAFLTGDFDSGTFHRYSFQWPDAPGEEPTSSVGHRAPSN